MIAIVDSGSTKSSWVFVDENNNKHNYRTIGFNPYYQTSDDIYQALQKELISQLDPSTFYLQTLLPILTRGTPLLYSTRSNQSKTP